MPLSIPPREKQGHIIFSVPLKFFDQQKCLYLLHAVAEICSKKLHLSSPALQMMLRQANDQRERLHPPSHKATVDRQVRLFWYLVKMSRLHFITPRQGRKPSVLSEELLLAQKREEKTYGDLRHFFWAVQQCFHGIAFISFRLSRILGKKNGGERVSRYNL